MPARYLTVTEFAGRISQEGGIEEALEAGLKFSALDPNDPASRDLRGAWSRLEQFQEELQQAVGLVDEVLDGLADKQA